MNSVNPENIYEWMESRSFAQLTPEEKALVMQEMDEETYSDMHAAIRHLDGFANDNTTRGKEAVWEAISAQSPMISQVVEPVETTPSEYRNQINWLYYKIPVGWAAAIILLLLFGMTWSLFQPVKTEITEVPVTQKDTVLVKVEVPKEVPVHDTVYLEKTPSRPKLVATQQLKTTPIVPSLEPELYIQPASESSEPINSTKRNSFQYDSLVGKIGFVTL